MPKLIECPGCTRHVRADDARCPFCERPSTTAAPSRMLVLALPLTLMACTAEGPAPASKPEVSKPEVSKPEVSQPEVSQPEASKPSPAELVKTPPSEPADGGAVIDPVPVPDDRVVATKYGGPPVMDDPAAVIDPDVSPPKPDEARPARKYGAPPRPDDRPAPKYGGAPKPGR